MSQASFQPRPLAPGGGISAASHVWSPANGAQPGGVGLQLPAKLAQGAPSPAGSAPGTPAAVPSKVASKQPSPVAPDVPEAKQTDVDSLMDPVGASGVDIGAEEESMRQANVVAHQAINPLLPGQDRSRKQDFIDPSVLAECVKKIAAAFQLRTLEPDTIPLIALATRHRLMSLVNDAVAARDHRLSASHLRPPPWTTRKRKRGTGSDDEDAVDEDEEDFDDDDEFDDFDGGEAKRLRRAAAKGKAREPEPAWDVLVYDDPEKMLGVLERVDREEERKRRRERMLRDQKEEEERALEDAIKASEDAQRSLDGLASTSNLDHLVMGASTPGASGSGAATPKGDETPGGKDKKPKKERKKKKDAPAVTARNMSEDVKKRLTDQVAMRQLGGRSFSWMNASGGAGSASAGFNSPTPGALPKPKFAPASSLPPPSFGSPGGAGADFGASTGPAAAGAHLPSALGRMSNVPPLHDASRARAAQEEWERGQHVVEVGDLVFALERERGMGVGKGTGRNVLLRARAGLGPRSNPMGGVGK